MNTLDINDQENQPPLDYNVQTSKLSTKKSNHSHGCIVSGRSNSVRPHVPPQRYLTTTKQSHATKPQPPNIPITPSRFASLATQHSMSIHSRSPVVSSVVKELRKVYTPQSSSVRHRSFMTQGNKPGLRGRMMGSSVQPMSTTLPADVQDQLQSFQQPSNNDFTTMNDTSLTHVNTTENITTPTKVSQKYSITPPNSYRIERNAMTEQRSTFAHQFVNTCLSNKAVPNSGFKLALQRFRRRAECQEPSTAKKVPIKDESVCKSRTGAPILWTALRAAQRKERLQLADDETKLNHVTVTDTAPQSPLITNTDHVVTRLQFDTTEDQLPHQDTHTTEECTEQRCLSERPSINHRRIPSTTSSHGLGHDSFTLDEAASFAIENSVALGDDATEVVPFHLDTHSIDTIPHASFDLAKPIHSDNGKTSKLTQSFRHIGSKAHAMDISHDITASNLLNAFPNISILSSASSLSTFGDNNLIDLSQSSALRGAPDPIAQVLAKQITPKQSHFGRGQSSLRALQFREENDIPSELHLRNDLDTTDSQECPPDVRMDHPDSTFAYPKPKKAAELQSNEAIEIRSPTPDKSQHSKSHSSSKKKVKKNKSVNSSKSKTQKQSEASRKSPFKVNPTLSNNKATAQQGGDSFHKNSTPKQKTRKGKSKSVIRTQKDDQPVLRRSARLAAQRRQTTPTTSKTTTRRTPSVCPTSSTKRTTSRRRAKSSRA